MATVKELKATARPKSGKGAARAERRAGRVPGVIYGNNQPPTPISVDDAELRQRILAGRFLPPIYDNDLEGKKHRVIPRDFHLDPVRDFPIHVDFMRLGEGATIRVSVPLRIVGAESAPGVKPLWREDVTLVTIVPPSGYAEEQKAAAAAAAAGTAAVAAPGAAPAAGAPGAAAGAPAAGEAGSPGGAQTGPAGPGKEPPRGR